MRKTTAERVQDDLLAIRRSLRERRSIHNPGIRWDYHWIKNGVVDHIDDHFSYLLPFRKKTEALLSSMGILTLRSLLHYSEQDLRRFPGIGPARLREIKVLLGRHGISLGIPSNVLRSLFGPPQHGRIDDAIILRLRMYVCAMCDSSGWIWCPVCSGDKSNGASCMGCHGHLIIDCPNKNHHHRKEGP